MSNTNFDNLAPVNFRPMIQDFLSARLVATKISDLRLKKELSYGQKIDWPYVSDPRVQGYTPGVDLDIDAQEAYSDQMSIDESQASTFPVTPKERVQARDKGYVAKLADRQGYVLANSIDYNLLKLGADNALNSVPGGAINPSNFISKLTDCSAAVENEDAADGMPFYVVDPDRRSVLTQVFVANGFQQGDLALKNGFMGRANGAEFYVSTNLPASVALTLVTNPTAGDTITIKGVTFTFQAAANDPGEIKIGANAAATQATVVLAINGTGVGDGTDYFELSTKNRRKLQNKQVSIAAFAANVATITAAGKINASSALTAPADGFGVENIDLLYGMKGAICLGMQIEPTLYIGKEPKRPEENYITHQLYGKKVFERAKARLCKLTTNA